MLELYRRDESDIPWTAVFDRARALAHRDARNDDLPIERAALYFAYPYGADFVYQARSRADTRRSRGRSRPRPGPPAR